MNDNQNSPGWNREVLRLAESIVNDDATDLQIARLDEILANDEAARSLYLDYIDVHAGLRRRYLSPDPDPEAQADQSEVLWRASPQVASWGRVLGLSSVLALAASLAVAFFMSDTSQSDLPGVAGVEPSHAASRNGVAVLSRAVGVEWADGMTPYRQGCPVPAGTLAIEAGLVQVEFYSGAIAVLEGPAHLELLSTELAELRAGKLRARVPTRARGFTIKTASGDIVDLGTEFAVEAPGDDAAGELHVLDGEVRFHPVARDSLDTVSLRKGDSVWLGEQDQSEPPSEADERFVGPTQVERLARRASGERMKAWRSHRERLLIDPDLVALYGYSPEPHWGRLLRNFAPGAEMDTHGAVVGAEWVEGRRPGAKALRFQNASHRVSLTIPGVYESLTLATWIAVDRFHPTNVVALLHPELEQERALFWTIDRVPSGAVLHFAETDQPPSLPHRRHYSSVAQGMFNSDVGQWVHLAVTYDAGLGRVSHYRNGRLVGWQPVKQQSPLSIGTADIGNWPYRDWAKGTEFEMRNLIGRMDEFVVLSRALSGIEVGEMYDAGAP